MTDEQQTDVDQQEEKTAQPAEKKKGGKKKLKKSILLLCDAIQTSASDVDTRLALLEKVRKLNS